MIRIAAAGDLHYGVDSAGMFRPHLEELGDRADLLLLAGDLTKLGVEEEIRVLADELEHSPIPVISVLGNHDYESGQEERVRKILEESGVQVLEGESTVLEVNGIRVGVAGTKGFGGGFAGANATDFGEEEMKIFVRKTKELAEGLEAALVGLDSDVKVALTHYSPVKDTLRGEPPEIYAFLGSYHLAEAIDRTGVDLSLHGHAHRGEEHGVTPGGVPVRNVAQHVIRAGYKVFTFEEGRFRQGRL